MTKFELSEEVVGGVINYLQRRPFAEVQELMQRLSDELKPQVEQESPSETVPD